RGRRLGRGRRRGCLGGRRRRRLGGRGGDDGGRLGRRGGGRLGRRGGGGRLGRRRARGHGCRGRGRRGRRLVTRAERLVGAAAARREVERPLERGVRLGLDDRRLHGGAEVVVAVERRAVVPVRHAGGAGDGVVR